MVSGAFDNVRWGSRLGSKNQNRATVAWFQFCHVKWRWRGGRWWRGSLYEMTAVVGWCVRKNGVGGGAENLKLSTTAQFWASYGH
jgi:hypothetical protein